MRGTKLSQLGQQVFFVGPAVLFYLNNDYPIYHGDVLLLHRLERCIR